MEKEKDKFKTVKKFKRLDRNEDRENNRRRVAEDLQRMLDESLRQQNDNLTQQIMNNINDINNNNNMGIYE